jgi:hypothetical protein
MPAFFYARGGCVSRHSGQAKRDPESTGTAKRIAMLLDSRFRGNEAKAGGSATRELDLPLTLRLVRTNREA